MIEYPQQKKLSDEYIIGKITYFLAEDIPNGDITTESTTSDEEQNLRGNNLHPYRVILPVCPDLIFWQFHT